MAEIYNFTLDQGADNSLSFQWKDGNGAAMNLTGYTARCMLKRNYDEAPVISLALGSGISIAALTGTITLSFSSFQTDTLSGNYLYDLELVSASGSVTRLVQGMVTISPSVTR